jgi:hypothetical protein
VSLLARAFGLRGGLIGAVIGFALFAVVEVVEVSHGVGDIDATGWITRGAGLFLLGALLGQATHRIEAPELLMLADHKDRRILTERSRRQAETLEMSDSILQYLAVAKWMIESGDDEAAIAILTSTMATGERMVADMRPIRRGEVDASAEAATT